MDAIVGDDETVNVVGVGDGVVSADVVGAEVGNDVKLEEVGAGEVNVVVVGGDVKLEEGVGAVEITVEYVGRKVKEVGVGAEVNCSSEGAEVIADADGDEVTLRSFDFVPPLSAFVVY